MTKPAFTEDNIIVVSGRLSMREDEAPKIIPDGISTPDEFIPAPPKNNAYSAKNVKGKDISVTAPKSKTKRVSSFIRYFEGIDNITVLSADNDGEVLYKGRINGKTEIMDALDKLINS